MRIAYLILAHHQPQHLGALIEQLDDRTARFFVHLDRKSEIEPFCNAVRSERAVFLDKRLPIAWGEWNLVQATLDLLQRPYRENPSAHYQLLSGDCYPIKSNEEIAAKLASGNFNYITINEQMRPGSRFYDRLIYRRSDRRLIKFLRRRRSLARLRIPTYAGRLIKGVRGKLDELTDRTLPAGIIPYKGWQWWCLSHDCARYVLDYVDANPRSSGSFARPLPRTSRFFIPSLPTRNSRARSHLPVRKERSRATIMFGGKKSKADANPACWRKVISPSLQQARRVLRGSSAKQSPPS
jgi:Core-2/I-Branching enzyme